MAPKKSLYKPYQLVLNYQQSPHIFAFLQFADRRISKSPSFVLSLLFKFILFSPDGLKASKPSCFFGSFLSMKPSCAT